MPQACGQNPAIPVPIRNCAPVSRRLYAVLALCLSACAPPSPERVSLALVPPAALAGESDAELAIEGLSALLLARLRALPEVQVAVDPAGVMRIW